MPAAPTIPAFSGPLPLRTDLANYETNSNRFMTEIPGVISGMNALSAFFNANLPTSEELDAAVAAADADRAAAEAAAGTAVAAANSAADDAAAAAASAAAAATFDPGNFVPIAGGVSLAGHLSVPSGASGNQAPRASEVGALANAQLTTHYKRSNIVGSVSQSGGVPTGAILEYGANANGEYVRFANGVQICWKAALAVGTLTTYWTFPAAFAGVATGYQAIGLGSQVTAYIADGGTASTLGFAAYNHLGALTAANISVVAFGRWY